MHARLAAIFLPQPPTMHLHAQLGQVYYSLMRREKFLSCDKHRPVLHTRSCRKGGNDESSLDEAWWVHCSSDNKSLFLLPVGSSEIWSSPSNICFFLDTMFKFHLYKRSHHHLRTDFQSLSAISAPRRCHCKGRRHGHTPPSSKISFICSQI